MAAQRGRLAQLLIALLLWPLALSLQLQPVQAARAPAPAQLAGCSGTWVLLKTVQPGAIAHVTGWPCYRLSPSNADSYYLSLPGTGPIPFNTAYEFSADTGDDIRVDAISNVVEIWGDTLTPTATPTATVTPTPAVTPTAIPTNSMGAGCVDPTIGARNAGDFMGKTWLLGTQFHQIWNLVYSDYDSGPIKAFGVPAGVTSIAVQVDQFSGASYSTNIDSYSSAYGGTLLRSDRLFYHYGNGYPQDPYYQPAYSGPNLYLAFAQWFQHLPQAQADICIWYGYSTVPTATATPTLAPTSTSTPIASPSAIATATPLPLPLGCTRLNLSGFDAFQTVTLLRGSYSLRAQRFTTATTGSVEYRISSGSPHLITFLAGVRVKTVGLSLVLTSQVSFDARNQVDSYLVDICPASTLATPTQSPTATATALAIGTPTATATASPTASATATLNPSWTPAPTALGTPIPAGTVVAVCDAPLPTPFAGAGQLPSLALRLPTLAPLPTVISATITISAVLVLSDTAQLVGAFAAPVATLTAWCQGTFGADGWTTGQAAAAPIAGQITSALGWLAFFTMIGPLAWLLPPIVISLLMRVAKAVLSVIKYLKQIIPFAG